MSRIRKKHVNIIKIFFGCFTRAWVPDHSIVVNFSTVVDVQKAIKLQIWAWQLIKRKFNFKISMFNLNEKDQRVV